MFWVLIAASRLSLVAEGGGYSLVVGLGPLTVLASLVVEHTGSRAHVRGLWYMGLAAPWPLGSS